MLKKKTFSIKNDIVNTELSTWLFIGTLTAVDAENAHFNKTFWHRKLNLEWQRFSNQFTFATRLYLPTLNNFNWIWVSLENVINFVCNPALLTRFYDKLLKLKPTETFIFNIYIAFQSISVPVHWLSIRRLKEIMFASFFAKVSKIFLYLSETFSRELGEALAKLLQFQSSSCANLHRRGLFKLHAWFTSIGNPSTVNIKSLKKSSAPGDLRFGVAAVSVCLDLFLRNPIFVKRFFVPVYFHLCFCCSLINIH